jgi:Mg2+ and Co2+ transporter CorA
MEKEFRALEKKIEEDEQKMLHRLITIRRSLWS